MLILFKGEFEEAEAHLQEALEIFKKEYGQDHPSVAVLLNNLARLLMETVSPRLQNRWLVGLLICPT